MTKIKTFCIKLILTIMSFLPLSILRFIGGFIGIMIMKLSKRTGARLRNNLLVTGISNQKNIDLMYRQTAAELGKTIIESVVIAWHRSKKHSANLVLEIKGLKQIKEAATQGAVVFLTPHIGNFEISLKSAAQNISDKKFNILYKPSKSKLLNQIMFLGRTEDNIKPVPTTVHGVISLIRAIKNKEMIGMLPDSVASSGDGVWVNFFDKPVFATTLAAKLTLMPGVKTFIVSSKRVSKGFVSEFIPYVPQSDKISEVVQELYKVFESIIKDNPTQYYWSYDRFRVPKKEHDSFSAFKAKQP